MDIIKEYIAGTSPKATEEELHKAHERLKSIYKTKLTYAEYCRLQNAKKK